MRAIKEFRLLTVPESQSCEKTMKYGRTLVDLQYSSGEYDSNIGKKQTEHHSN